MTADLVAFVRARLDEEWEVAHREGTNRRGDPISATDWEHVAGEADSMLVGIFSPARVLGDVEAKRQVLGLLAVAERHLAETRRTAPEYRLVAAAEAPRDALLLAVQFLAMPYADHPDYREGWRPSSSWVVTG